MSAYTLMSYSKDNSEPRAGLIVKDHVFDVARLLGDSALSTIEQLLASWDDADRRLSDAVERLAANGDGAIDPQDPALVGQRDAVKEEKMLRPGAIFCVGANYQQHIDRMAAIRNVDMGKSTTELGLPPYIFIKPLQSLAGSGEVISVASRSLDYEGELGAVIGRAAANVGKDDALDYVAGYFVANDLSARDRFIRPGVPPVSPFRCDWVGHKVFDGSCPIGSDLLPARFVKDPQDLRLKTWVNEELRQDSSTSDMIYSVAEIIAYLSTLVTLQPGDLILTGTPSGVASETGNFLRDGDKVTVHIQGIGNLFSQIRIL